MPQYGKTSTPGQVHKWAERLTPVGPPVPSSRGTTMTFADGEDRDAVAPVMVGQVGWQLSGPPSMWIGTGTGAGEWADPLSGVWSALNLMAPAASPTFTGLAQFEGISASGAVQVGRVPVAFLPSAGFAGRLMFATDGRKAGESAGAGTGVLVCDDGAGWRRVSDDAAVAA